MKDIVWLKKAIKYEVDSAEEKYKERLYSSNEPMKGFRRGKWEAYDKSLRIIDQVEQPALPVIPRFVAEWIENNDSVGWWRKIAEWEREVPEKDRKVYDWYQNYNEDDFIIAWITEDYTIVEEQKYQVIIKDGEHVRLYLSKSHDAVSIGTNDNYIEKCPEVTYLTEQEIKDFDERFWPFAVKLEELEE